MKRLRDYFAGALSMLLIICLVGTAYATRGKIMQELEYRDIRVSLDGKVLDLRNAIGEPVEPFMFGGTNYLPVRALAEALGLNVAWNGQEVMVVLTTPEPSPTPTPTPTPIPKDTYSIGETWIVPGQWELTVNSVEVVTERNPYSDKNPAAVYRVNYTYKNIGYDPKDSFLDGLYMDLDSTVIDSEGFTGSTYPGDITNYPKAIPVGASCNAQVCLCVEHAGSFRIAYSDYDSNSVKRNATFLIDIPQN